MNLTEAPYSSYTRAPQSFVSAEGAAPILVWKSDATAGISQDAQSGESHWVAHGCASCHGLDGTGGVGLNLLGKTAADIEDRVRSGPKGMPAFDPLDVPDDHIAALVDYVDALTKANPGAVPTPTATPRPAPGAVATAPPTPPVATSTPIPSQTAAPIPPAGAPATSSGTAVPATPVPAVTPATPTPTAEPTEAPTVPASDGAGDDLVAQGKKLYTETAGVSGQGCAYCHGLDGKGAGEGASNAPDIRGFSRSKVRSAMTNVLDMRDIKLSAEEIEAIVEYLKLLDEQS